MWHILTSSILIKAIGSALAALMFLMIARTLSVEAFGNFSAGFSAAQAISAISCLGLHTAVLRETAAALGKGDKAGADNAAHEMSRMALFTLLLAMAIPLIALPFGYGLLLPLSVGVLAAMLNWSEFVSSLMRGYGSIAWALAPREIFWRSAIVLAAMGMLFFQLNPGRGAVWIAISSAFLMAIVLGQWWTFRQRPRQFWRQPSGTPQTLQEFIVTNWELWAIVSLGVFEAHMSIVLVRALLDAESTALLFVAMKFSAVIALPIMAAGPAIAPQIAAAYASGDIDRVQRIGAVTALVTTCGAFLGLIVIVYSGEWALMFLGPDYAQANDVLIILASFQLISAMLGPTGFAILMMQQQRIALIALVLGVLTSAAMITVLSRNFGVIGAAIGIGTILLVNKGTCYAYLWKQKGVHMSIFGFLNTADARIRF